MEISPMIETDVRRLLESESALEVHSTIKDLAGLPRVMQARKK
jgi:hypothetical protein